MNYYNEFDSFAADWLENLIAAGLIPQGHIDRRSIKEVQPDDLQGYTQCHFFAGIGGWCEALRLSGWPSTKPVWTGSCPCQPFSAAGKGEGQQDERNLWPAMFSLIEECRPDVVFGEQVDDAIEYGWLDDLCDDLEGADYSCGSAILPACSVGSPTKRQRAFWVAESASEGRCWRESMEARPSEELRRSGPDVRFDAWPDGRGSLSTIAVAELLSPSYGVPGRVGRLRGYGNAIVPSVAAEFIRAFLESRE